MSYNEDDRKRIHKMYDIHTNLQGTRYWTYDALECYSRFCHCPGCRLQELVTSQKCRLNFTVNRMLDELGTPTQEDCERVRFNYERLKTWE